MLKDNRLSEKKKEVLKEQKKEISMEIKEVSKNTSKNDADDSEIQEKKSKIINKEKTEPTAVSPRVPVIKGYSTLRNKSRKLRLGF